jgi:hypothetical protein
MVASDSRDGKSLRWLTQETTESLEGFLIMQLTFAEPGDRS